MAAKDGRPAEPSAQIRGIYLMFWWGQIDCRDFANWEGGGRDWGFGICDWKAEDHGGMEARRGGMADFGAWGWQV